MNIPTTLFDMIPMPILLVEHVEDTLDHPVAYMNPEFTKQLGWTLHDIPSKFAWWQKAYPSEEYQKAVSRQWELEVELAQGQGNHFVLMEADIHTKNQGEKRFKVYTEFESQLLPGYYVVGFELIDK